MLNKILKENKDTYLVILISIVAFILYSLKLKESLAFFNDTARDTIRVLEIIKNKQLTLIGPPLSFGQLGIREVYFGSIALYIGAIGLLITKLDAVGAIYPNIFFFVLSIYFFFKLMKSLSGSKNIQIISTLIYAFSPTTVTFARFFWNPNLIIPFSVIFWLLLLQKYSSKKQKILGLIFAGFIGGLMINFHYISFIPVLIYSIYLLFKKKILYFISLISGCLITSIPLILFELRHEFYLTQALIYNLTHNEISNSSTPRILHFFDSLLLIFGFKSNEMINPIININLPFFYPIVIIVLSVLIIKSFQSTFKNKQILLIIILVMNFAAIRFTGDIFNIHYLFPVYPLLIWYSGTLISQIRIKIITYSVIILMILSSILILFERHNIKKDYLSLSKIEKISSYIVHDNPNPPYNMTENITGGAQAIPFRYVLVRDAKVQINDKLSYTGLKTLYVVTSDINKTYKENRWEFYATPNMRLTKTINFDEVKLFRFEK